jgi:hypothetical protein
LFQLPSDFPPDLSLNPVTDLSIAFDLFIYWTSPFTSVSEQIATLSFPSDFLLRGSPLINFAVEISSGSSTQLFALLGIVSLTSCSFALFSEPVDFAQHFSS